MQNYYEAPKSELKVDERKRDPLLLVFFAGNSGVLTLSALAWVFLYFTDNIDYFSINKTLVFGFTFSLPASILIIPFRKIPWYWAAIAGSLLSIILCFAAASLGLI
jgi:hypothetical protein